MNEITTTNRAALSHRSGEEVTAEAMLDFVKWVDRGERTTAAYIKNLRQFAAWLSFSGITSPTRDDIAAYRDYLSKPHRAISLTPAGWIYRTTAAGDPIEITCKPSTVAQYIRIVRQFFTWAYNSGRISRNIAEGIRAPKVSNEHKKEIVLEDYEFFLCNLSTLSPKENTLKYHNKNIYGKLGVSSRKQLIAVAKATCL